MKMYRICTVALLALVASGCATPINSAQKREYSFYQAKGIVVEEKNPGAGAALGILPGGGSFYVREYGLGIVNLLLWPGSILWDPVSGYDGSIAINYYATKELANQKMKRELADLDDAMLLNKVSKEEYVIKRRSIESAYQPN